MKVLIINTYEIQSRVARVAYQLHQAFTIIGPFNKTKTQEFIGIHRPILNALPLKIYKNKTNILFPLAWLSLDRKVDFNKDIIQKIRQASITTALCQLWFNPHQKYRSTPPSQRSLVRDCNLQEFSSNMKESFDE